MVFLSRFIIGLGGFDFVVERADSLAFAIMAYLNIPFLCSFLPAYSFIFRGWILSEVYPVIAVLPVGGRSQVRFAIVEAFMVDMIDV